jgi:hypothetical protein
MLQLRKILRASSPGPAISLSRTSAQVTLTPESFPWSKYYENQSAETRSPQDMCFFLLEGTGRRWHIRKIHGLAPLNIQNGDRIWYFYGTKYAFVARPSLTRMNILGRAHMFATETHSSGVVHQPLAFEFSGFDFWGSGSERRRELCHCVRPS